MSQLAFFKRIGLLYRIFVRRVHFKFYFRLPAYLFQRFFLQQQIPLAVMIALTYKCQCSCVHCAVENASNVSAGELTTREIKLCLDGLSGLGVLKVGFTGGEPLLRPDICDLVAYAYRKGLSVAIDTNGILLSPDMVLKLKRAGLTGINVSIDHPDAVSHDRLRKHKGCFDKAVTGIRECVRQNVPCVISTYVTRWSRSKARLNEIIEMARQIRVTGVRVLFPIYSGKLLNKQRHLLSREDKRDFFRTVVDPNFVYSESPLFDFITHKVECTAHRKLSIYVMPDGTVKPCYATAQAFGNVRRADIGEILKAGKYFQPGSVLKLKCEALDQGC